MVNTVNSKFDLPTLLKTLCDIQNVIKDGMQLDSEQK